MHYVKLLPIWIAIIILPIEACDEALHVLVETSCIEGVYDGCIRIPQMRERRLHREDNGFPGSSQPSNSLRPFEDFHVAMLLILVEASDF